MLFGMFIARSWLVSLSSNNCYGVVCCLGCLSLVHGISGQIISKIAFFPPSPPGYLVVTESRESTATKIDNDSIEVSNNETPKMKKVVFLVDVGQFSFAMKRFSMYRLPSIDITEYGCISINHVEIPVTNFGTIHALHFTREDASHTLIVSHGNSTDIGVLFPWLLQQCRVLGPINIIAYDYNSYGASDGETCSEAAIYADIVAVYEFLTGKTFGLSPERIVLYGQSLGSAPTIFLASRVPNIAGIIIHSGMRSGLTVFKSDCSKIHWFDAFKNVELIQKVKCPVFIIHGRNDRDIGIEHGICLYEAAIMSNSSSYWWVENAGHNDIEILQRREYLVRMYNFLDFIGCYSHYGKHKVNSISQNTTEDNEVFNCGINQKKEESSLIQRRSILPSLTLHVLNRIEKSKLQTYLNSNFYNNNRFESIRSSPVFEGTRTNHTTPKSTARESYDAHGNSRIPMPSPIRR